MKHKGFYVIEVLITIAVIAIGFILYILIRNVVSADNSITEFAHTTSEINHIGPANVVSLSSLPKVLTVTGKGFRQGARIFLVSSTDALLEGYAAHAEVKDSSHILFTFGKTLIAECANNTNAQCGTKVITQGIYRVYVKQDDGLSNAKDIKITQVVQSQGNIPSSLVR